MCTQNWALVTSDPCPCTALLPSDSLWYASPFLSPNHSLSHSSFLGPVDAHTFWAQPNSHKPCDTITFISYWSVWGNNNNNNNNKLTGDCWYYITPPTSPLPYGFSSAERSQMTEYWAFRSGEDNMAT